MNLSHFPVKPIYLELYGLPKDPKHELFTMTHHEARTVEILCRCGWSTKRSLSVADTAFLMGKFEELAAEMAREAREHLLAQVRAPSLGELTEFGWFDPGVW